MITIAILQVLTFIRTNKLILHTQILEWQVRQGADRGVRGGVQRGPQISQRAASVPGQHRWPVRGDLGRRPALGGHPGQPAPRGLARWRLQRLPHGQVPEVVSTLSSLLLHAYLNSWLLENVLLKISFKNHSIKPSSSWWVQNSFFFLTLFVSPTVIISYLYSWRKYLTRIETVSVPPRPHQLCINCETTIIRWVVNKNDSVFLHNVAIYIIDHFSLALSDGNYWR